MTNATRSQFTALLLIAALLIAATLACADDAADRQRFYLESIRPTVEHLESIAPQQTDTGAIILPTQDSYDLAMPGDLISLRRNFTRSVVDRAASGPLHMAFMENLTTEAGVNLGATALSFSSTFTEVKDLLGLSLDAKRVDVMGLRQKFGGGDSASTLGFTHTVTEQRLNSSEVSTTLDALEFHSGLTKQTDLALKASRATTDVKDGLEETNLETVLKIAFSGGETPFAYAQNHKYNATQDILTEKMDFGVPLKVGGGKAIAEFHSAFTTTNGIEVGTRTTHLAMPFRVAGQAWSFDHLIFDENKGVGIAETSTTKIVTPFKLAGTLFATEGSRVLVQQNGIDVETLTARLAAPVLGSQAVVQQQIVTTEGPGGISEVEQLALTMPTIKLGKLASLSGTRVSTDVLGISNQDVTNISMSADPLKPLHIDAQYQVNDLGPQQVVTSRQVQTRWAICDKTALTGRFSQSEAPGVANPSILRVVELVRDKDSAGLGLRAGIASYEIPGAEVENARRLELTLGKPKILAINAAYSEYDPNSLSRLPEDPAVAFSVEHGTPDTFMVRYRYEDQPTRAEPLRALELATKALGAKLQLSYATNPMAPDGKTVLQTDQYGASIGTTALGATVQLSYAANPMSPDGKTLRMADQYEATVGRKIMGDLNLELGYRYLTYEEDGNIDQNIRIKLDGGNESKSGKLALAFFTGDFAPNPSGQPVPPSSVLDLTFSRKWEGLGRVTLSLKRQTAGTTNLGDDSTEGRLELNRQF